MRDAALKRGSLHVGALRRSAVAALAGLGLAAAGLAQPSPAAAATGPDVLRPAAADTRISAKEPAKNFGTDAVVYVMPKPVEINRTLVRFVVPTTAFPLDVPEECLASLESASLRMYQPAAVTGHTLQVRRTAAFPEATVTWDSKPAYVGTAGVATASSGLGYRSWNVTAHVQAIFAAGVRNAAFDIRDAAEGLPDADGKNEFHAREKLQSPPELVLRYAGDPAPPEPLACGSVVTESVVLDRDLLNCPGDGLVIGANNITVDLGDFWVDGSSLGTGIANSGYDGVTIKGGTVREFDNGVVLGPGTRANVVEGMSLVFNEYDGVLLDGAGGSVAADGNIVRNNSVRLNGRGLALSNGARFNVLDANSVADSSNGALVLDNADDNTIKNIVLTGSGDGSVHLIASDRNTLIGNSGTDASDAAFRLELGSDSNRLEANKVGGITGDDGFALLDSTNNTLLNNDARGAGDAGIALHGSSSNTLTGNDVSSNSVGIGMTQSNANTVQSNNANRSTTAGIELADSARNTILNNSASLGVVGIAVTGSLDLPQGNVFDGNTASHNTGAGIYIAVGNDNRVQNNTTSFNAGYGIDAIAGTIDGGGNVAEGNHAGQVADPSEPPLEQCGQPGVVTCTAPAPPPPEQCPAATAYPSNDTWIDQGDPNMNFAFDQSLKVRSSWGENARALVKFRLPSVPAGCQVKVVSLTMFNGKAMANRYIRVMRANKAWNEQNATWMTGNGVNTAVGGIGTDAVVRQLVPAGPSSSMTWDVSAMAQLWYGGAVNNGFLIRDASESSTVDYTQEFTSRDAFMSGGVQQDQPTLNVTFEPAP